MGAMDHVGRSGQIPRLEREEQDLRDRLAKHMSALERAGREHRSDPIYQGLASVLRTIRRQLARAHGDHGERLPLAGQTKNAPDSPM